jgi:hypothetical protein
VYSEKKEITLLLFTFKDRWGLIKKLTLLRNFYKYLPVAIILLLAGCGDDEPANLSATEYFPLCTGFYQIYSVEETKYSAVNPATHESYELKTEVVDSFLNDMGTHTYVLYRSKRQTENHAWEFMESWSARITPFQGIVTEGNISFVRLVFPASVNARWNGNQLNTQEPDEYTIVTSGQHYTLENGETFADCVAITQHDDFDILERDQRQEVYARNIGLIYKKSVVLNYCRDSQSITCPFGVDFIIDGFEYEQVLKSYGQN